MHAARVYKAEVPAHEAEENSKPQGDRDEEASLAIIHHNVHKHG